LEREVFLRDEKTADSVVRNLEAVSRVVLKKEVA
jgi:hypothetical protein